MEYKIGDILKRGGHILKGQLMIVEERRSNSLYDQSKHTYKCVDMFNENQHWLLYEDSDFTIATDDDIIAELIKRVDTYLEIQSEYGTITVNIDDDEMFVSSHGSSIVLCPRSAIALRNNISQYIEEAYE